MKRNLHVFLALLFVVFASQTKGQHKATAQNFPEVFAGVEWNTASGMTGISYERYLHEKNEWILGVRITHAFDYSLANMALFSYGDGGHASFNSTTATVHKFFVPNQKGFFLCSELGWGLRKYQYYAVEYSTWFVASEFGFGCQFAVGRKLAIRWSNTITFAGKGGITATKLSIGF
jgi:hypothetical protein